MNWKDFVPMDWRGVLEVLILWVCIYSGWRSIRGTRGAKVLTGLALLILIIATISGFFNLPVLGWLFRNVSTVVLFGMIVLFQPEIRRALAALGSHRLFATVSQTPEMMDRLTEATFDLANRQLGALLAIERDQTLDVYGEGGTDIDAAFVPSLVVSLFFPKTPLHDGGGLYLRKRGTALHWLLRLTYGAVDGWSEAGSPVDPFTHLGGNVVDRGTVEPETEWILRRFLTTPIASSTGCDTRFSISSGAAPSYSVRTVSVG